MPPERAYPRRRQHARPPRQHHAQQRRLLPARERLQHEQARGPRALQALEQALVELGRPETLAPEVKWRRQRVGKLLGTIFGVMCPTLGGGRTADEWPRLRRWDTHLPGQLLGALPTQKGGRQWPHRGQDLLALLWPQVEDHSPATHSRGPWTWVGDDRGVKTDGQQ